MIENQVVTSLSDSLSRARCDGANIPEGWKNMHVSDVASINEMAISKKYAHKNIDYLDVASVDRGRIINRQQLKLNEAPSRARRIVRDKDILISTVRPNLKHFAFIDHAHPNTIASTGFAVITAKSIDARFLYYYLATDKYTNYLSAIADAHTSTYPSFNPDVIEKSSVSCPPPEDQRAIAKILSDLDEKIELNHRMNKTLESIAQSIFKRWFVDFEFPNEKGKPYKLSGGKMVKSELGEIPQGWDVKELSDCGRIVCGKTPPTADKANYGEDIFFVTIPDMRGQTFVIRTERKLSKER
ncbi:MAG: restriction endonuclease subunit S [Candidatus Omnitrophica bacterium]|nr:restriction endonuclease subunit S [Candidatus Omnitrophota bacterium]